MKTQKTWKKGFYFTLHHKWVAIPVAFLAVWFILSNLGELILLGIILYLALKWYPNYLEKKQSGQIKPRRTPRAVVIIEHDKADYIQDESVSQTRQVV